MILKKIKQKILKNKYNKARELYIIGRWANWGILPVKYADKIDEEGNPLTIHYTDHNGYYEEYYIGPWYTETTGHIIGYSFNRKQAENIAHIMEVYNG